MPCTFLVCPKLSWVFQMPTSLEKWINIWQSSHPSITEFNQHFQDFPAIDNDIKMFSTPFSVNVEVQENVQLELIELQCDDSLRSRHQFFFSPVRVLPEFRNIQILLIKRHAQSMMSLFGSTYICEQSFSLMMLKKCSLRASLSDSNLCDLLCISTTRLTPDLTSILKSEAQHHC